MAAFEPVGIDPALGGRGTETTINLFEPLIDVYAADGRLRPLAAAQWSFDEAGTTLTVALRRGLRWSDGEPLTMQHYRDGLLRVLEPGRATFRAEQLFVIRNAEAYHAGDVAADAVGLRVVDDHTLVVELEGPTAHVLRALGRPEAFPVRLDLLDAQAEGHDAAVSWVGNGPFMIERWDAGQRMVLVPNPSYAGVWREHRRLDRVEVSLVADPWRQAVAGFADGTLDVALVPPSDVAGVLADPAVAPFAQAVAVTGAVMLAFDTEHGPTADRLVRRALAQAIDDAALVSAALAGTALPATSFTPSGVESASGQNRHRHDPDGARTLLAAAGYPAGHGFPTFELVHVDQPLETALAAAIASMWRRVLGIEVDLVALDPVAVRTYRAERARAPFDAYMFLTWSTLGDASQFHNALFDAERTTAHTGYADPAYLALVRTAANETDTDRRATLYREAEAMINHDVPILSLVQDARVWLIRPHVDDFATAVTGVGGLIRLAAPPGVRTVP